nr:hypothetical protein [Tanacetum cinerariifolium]
NCGGAHETFECQPTNEEYYHEQNSGYRSNSFGFDHCQPSKYTVNHPIFNAHNDFLNSQNELSTSQNTIMEKMTQLTSMCEMVCQIVQKKQEEKRIEEEQAANARYWKIPACCDEDEDYDSAITPVLSTEEPVNSLSMGDEHLDTISATESDEVIKSSVEDLVSIPKFNSENSNAEIESFSPSPIPNEDSDSFMEEIDLSFNLDDLMPPSIEDDDNDSEGDNLFLERLLHDDPIPLPDTLDFSNVVRVFLPFFTYLDNSAWDVCRSDGWESRSGV